MKTNQMQNSGKIKFGHRIAYGLGDFAGNMMSGATASYITLYYTDNVLISAAMVGTLMIIARVFDALSDLVMGYIIDHTNLKFGKARSWLLIGIVPLIISFFLIFHVPAGLEGIGRSIYVVATYIFNTVICMTILNVSYSTLCTYMSDDIQTRMKLTGTRTFFATLAMMLANIFTVEILGKYGFSQTGYDMMILIYGGGSLFCLLITGMVCKENSSQVHADEEKPNTTFKDSVTVITSNRYILILAGAFLLNWLLLGVNGASMVYFVRDVLGGMQFMSIISAASFLPALIILALDIVPRVAKKFGKRSALLIGGGIEAAGFLIAAALPATLQVIVIGMVLKSVGMGFVNALLFATVSDVAVYTDITEKGDFSGVTNSISSFGQKIGIGLGSAAIGWLLAWGQYDASLTAQTAHTQFAVKLGFCIIPFICAVLVMICISFIDVDKKLEAIKNR
ncbi:glycoside-pentoside-hexuronide (GPH):cation symporter [Ruminococcus sp. CLA-AA-H200]|uniref:Glycoside-pentoside-hexuronide (GPH):cation symporter n=1 Tax=Ruminococcus turbiniformis TaxID=2881258 RepID=A0ABS8FTA0_9FIRM|nr:glycoside-pentoside-hexuronide (GPH):cation symporter [Ruminococcus turbiniformis]MCC2253271.1 glycoside-pentoside-hexuronide (GPH):cation symporter [Ruminococcus turbiniformis]